MEEEMDIIKPVRIKQAEDILAKIISDNKNNYKKIYYDPRFDKIESLLEEQFGLEKLILDINPQEHYAAHTIPVIPNFYNSVIPGYYDLIKDENGIRYKNPKGKTVYISIGFGIFDLVDNKADRLMAIILHEMGHNFFQTGVVGGTLKVMLWPLAYAGRWTQIKNIELRKTDKRTREAVKKSLDELEQQRKRPNPPEPKIVKRIKVIIDTYLSYQFLYLAAVGSLGGIGYFFLGMKVLLGPINASAGEGYTNERFSDNFAAIHGYGLELAQALIGFHKQSNLFYTEKELGENDKKIAANKAFALIALLSSPISGIGDPHPNTSSRCKEILTKMEQAHSEAQTKKQRQYLAIQIKLMKENIAEVEKIDNNRTATARLSQGSDFFKRWVNGSVVNPDGEIESIEDRSTT
jgi:hypothetical protein